ncbi:MAG: hypothetical protein IJB83_04415 [Bacilli bacterium]|nr:hypothetical protein [Bacilli bacterium]
MNNYKLILNFYIFFSIIVLILAISLFIYTKKYKKTKVRILGLFLDLTKKESVLLSTNLLSLLLNIWCCLNIENYNALFLLMIIFNSLITIIISLNIRMILLKIISTSITLLVLKLLSLINTYINNINYNVQTHILNIVFLITIIIYSCFVSIRELELLLKKNIYVRRNI